MTRRETRKIRTERRARIGTECLESRNLLSALGATASAQLISAPPSGSYQTVLLGGIESDTYMKITGPKESVAYFKQDSPQTSVWGATGPIAQLKYTFEAPVSGSYQTALFGPTESATQMKITGPDVKPQTALFGPTESVAQMKITSPKESVADSKQDIHQTALWGATGPVALLKYTGPDVKPQTSPSAATDSFNFG